MSINGSVLKSKGVDSLNLDCIPKKRFSAILADPPWRFNNGSGKVAPEHRRLTRYRTLSLGEILALPISELAAETAHLYLWVPRRLLEPYHNKRMLRELNQASERTRFGSQRLRLWVKVAEAFTRSLPPWRDSRA
jgi:N6-adenosine-specific RNA methylase IME4